MTDKDVERFYGKAGTRELHIRGAELAIRTGLRALPLRAEGGFIDSMQTG